MGAASRSSTGAPPRLAPAAPGSSLRLVERRPLRVADVALWYGERSGGVRTYLDAKTAWAAATGAIDHHVIVPGPGERHEGARHELPSLRVAASSGYRLPFGAGALRRTLRAVRPDVVLLHDPYWRPVEVTELAHELDARVLVVHHASSAHNATGLPGPTRLYRPLMQSWFRRAYGAVDGVMSAVDPFPDTDRAAVVPLRLGIEPAFRPQPDVARGDHVLYVGRLSREKGVFELLEAAALADEEWPLLIVGSGPAEHAVTTRVERLGLGPRVAFRPYVTDREELARTYAAAGCVAMPGALETFGLVGLEAAASGAHVAAASNAASAAIAAELVESFAPGDVSGLLAAVERARRAPRNLAAAARLAERLTWEHAFTAETRDLERLAA